MIDSIRTSALKGIQGGLQRASQAAERISTAYQPNGDGDIVDDAVALKQAEREVQANTKVMRSAERMEDAVLDILA